MLSFLKKKESPPVEQAAPRGPGSVQYAREYARRGKNLTAELPYLAIRRGLMLNRDGSVEFGVRMHPVSAARLGRSGRDAASTALTRALTGTLEPGTRVRHYTVSHAAGRDALAPFLYEPVLQNPVVRLLHEARQDTLRFLADNGQLSDVRTFLTVSVPRPKRARNTSYFESEFRELFQDVAALRRDLTEQLMSSGLWCSEMGTQEVFREVYGYLNPGLTQAGAPLYDSELDGLDLAELSDRSLYHNTLREQVACTGLDHSNDSYLLLDDRHVATVSMRKAGESTLPGMSERMMTRLAGRDYILLNEFTIQDSSSARARINAQLDNMEYERVALNAGRETDRRVAVGTAVLDAIETGSVLGRWAHSVLLLAGSQRELNRAKQDAVTVYREMKGVTPVVGDAQNLELFLDSAPFGGAQHPYPATAWARNFADFMPLAGPWAGSRDPLIALRNAHGGLTGINPLSDSVNYGMVVAGEAGSGKTHLVSVLLTAFAAAGARTTCIDMKDGYVATYEALEGAILEIGPGAALPDGRPVTINMFDLGPDDAMPGPDKVARVLSLLRLMEVNTTPLRRNILQNAINTLYLRFSEPLAPSERERYWQRNDDGQPLTPEPPTHRYLGTARLRDLVSTVRGLNQLGTEGIVDPFVRSEQAMVAREIEAYCALNNSPIGVFLDGFTTVSLDNPHTYLRGKALGEDPVMQAVGLLLMSDLVWGNGLRYPTTVKFNVNEEVGMLAQIDGAKQLLTRQYKLGREYAFVPCAVSQEAEDMAAIRGIANNVSTVIIGSMKENSAAAAVAAFNLPASVQELMVGLGGRARSHREYVVVQFKSSGTIDGTRAALYTNELEMAMFSSNFVDKERREVLRREMGGSLAAAALKLAEVS